MRQTLPALTEVPVGSASGLLRLRPRIQALAGISKEPHHTQLFITHSSPPQGFPGGSEGKESTRSAGDPGSIPGLGRFPGEGNGNPLHYSYLENPMDRGAWRARDHRVAKSCI